ncbi:hypothetical protein CO614_08470 [Lysobacteraceae bacterium NML120232]|nr:hypothetical protein CO608_05160 [Xanthomonadaceae bacterium NML08-0793]PJK10813.1 hypothetical protein CO614_08470 [Xanthomonadaceae bacterium NML120232]
MQNSQAKSSRALSGNAWQTAISANNRSHAKGRARLIGLAHARLSLVPQGFCASWASFLENHKM